MRWLLLSGVLVVSMAAAAGAVVLRPIGESPNRIDLVGDADRDEIWNRGRELARGAAHFGACHTGRNIAGALIETNVYSGNDELPGGDPAPSIQLEHLLNQGWAVESLVYALETGITPSGDVFAGDMGEVVQNSTSFLTPEDRLAIATYIMEPEEEALTRADQ